MQKRKLFALPLVMLLAACNNQGGGSKPVAEPSLLPDGGTEVSPDDDVYAYKDTMQSAIDGASVIFDQNIVQVDTYFSLEMKDFEESIPNASIAADGSLTAYIAAPQNEEEYLKADFEIKNLNLTVDLGSSGTINMKKMNLKLYYRVVEDEESQTVAPRIFIDLSDKNMLDALVALAKQFLGASLSGYTDQQIKLVLATFLGYNYKGYYPIDVQEGEDPDVFYSGITAIKEELAEQVFDVDSLLAMLDKYPTLKEWKDESGSTQQVGFEFKQDMAELINSILELAGQQQQVQDELPVEVDLDDYKLKKADVKVALVSSTSKGSEGFALDTLYFKLDSTTSSNAKISLLANSEFRYNDLVTYRFADDSKLAQFNTDYSKIASNYTNPEI